MDSTYVVTNLLILIALIACSALFSCSETALISINDIKLRSMKDKGYKNYDKLCYILSDTNKLLTAILIMNNLVNILASSLATVIAYNLIGSAGVGIATGIVTFFVLIFGEITPKNLAIKNSEKIALKVAPIIFIMIKILIPLIFILNKLITFLLRESGENSHQIITQNELETMVDVSSENGILDDVEKEMIFNVFDFKNTQVKDIMVNRLNIVAIDINDTYGEIKKIIDKEKFSRYPVYDGELDNIVGTLNTKDLLFVDTSSSNFSIKDYLRECSYTYEFKNTNDLFKEMKKNRNHMNVVFDEYGAVVGLVTIEDLIEEILGEIEDEYDTIEDKDIVVLSDNECIVSGSTSLSDINSHLDSSFYSEEMVSIGGFLLDKLGRFPRKKEVVTIDNVSFHILDINKNTIKKIKILKTGSFE